MNKGIVFIRSFIRQLTKDNINVFAASAGFFFFLSLFPTLFVICALIPYTPLTEGNLIEAVIRFTPDSMDALVIFIIEQSYHRSFRYLPVAVLIAIWSSGKGMLALMRGLNVVNEAEENRNYFMLRIEASVYMVITIAAILVTLLISVFGKILFVNLLHKFHYGGKIVSYFISGCSIFVWIFLIIVFTIVYTYVPNKKVIMAHQIPGAVFSALGWNLSSFAFSFYMEHFVSVSIYGSFSTVIFLMIWLYFCIYILLIGANLNRYFHPAIRLFFMKKEN